MLAVTNVPIKTEDGRGALTQCRHGIRMRQRHLLILTDGARTVDQLHQLLSDWSDLDDLLMRLQWAGMVDVLPGIPPENAVTVPPFDPITHFNRPLFDDHSSPSPAALPRIYDKLPPLTGMTLGLQAVAVPIDEPAANDASKPCTMSVQVISAPQSVAPPESANVLPNVVRVELIRLAVQHFGPATDTAMPLLRAYKEDSQSLCGVVTVCTKAAAPLAGEHAAAKFASTAMQAVALRR